MNMMCEEWSEVYSYDILFEVSTRGRVRTKHHGKKGYQKDYVYMQPTDNGKGYMRLNLKQSGKQKTVYVHELVALAFIPNPNGYVEVNHKDENKSNNNVENLEWCEHIYNCNYGTSKERIGRKNSVGVLCVETNQVFNSVIDASETMGVGATAISNCLNGRSKSSCGYTWRYANV